MNKLEKIKKLWKEARALAKKHDRLMDKYDQVNEDLTLNEGDMMIIRAEIKKLEGGE